MSAEGSVSIEAALAALNGGRAADCAAICRAALATQPQNPNWLHLFALATHAQGDLEQALSLLRETAALAPGDATIPRNLGVFLAQQQRFDEAISSLERSLALAPGDAGTRNNLVTALHQAKRYDRLIDYCRTWLAADPMDALTALRLARALAEAAREPEGLAVADAFLQRQPDHRDLLMERGNLLLRLGHSVKAEANFRRLLALEPGRDEARIALGVALTNQREFAKAARENETLLAMSPANAPGWRQAGEIAAVLGEIERADQCFARAQELRASPGLAITRATLLPAIFDDEAQIGAARQRYTAKLDQLEAEGLKLEESQIEMARPSWFYLAYHGLEDRTLQSKLAGLFLKACPTLGWQAPQLGSQRRPPRRRLRIGFCSSFLTDHTIGVLNEGFVRELDRQRFEVVLLRRGPARDAGAQRMDRAADAVIRLPRDIVGARRAIAEADLNLLYYPEIGMDPFVYFLAFARLAPVQCVGFGHPDTTGIPNIDYYLSSEWNEPPGAAAHYSEKLHLLPSSNVYFYRPPAAAPPMTRADFGLPEQGPLFLCLVSQFKLHPQFDAVIAAILAGDAEARILFCTGHCREWDEILRRRFAKSFPAALDRIEFRQWVGHPDFYSLCRLADGFIDPIHFGCGRTGFDIFTQGLPFATWPGQFMRGRCISGQLRQMEMGELIAKDPADLARICLRLGQDRDWARDLRRQIQERAAVLYENRAVIRAFEGFLEGAISDAAR